MRSTRGDRPGYIVLDGEKYLESSDDDVGDVVDTDVNDVELFDMLLKVRNHDPSLNTIQEVISLVDKYNNLDDEYVDIEYDDVEYEKKLDEYFNNDDKLSEKDKCFLKEFFRKKMWICKDGDGFDNIDLLLEDEIDMLRQESYETAYSLRYEEYGEQFMRVHSGYFEESIRELEDVRKRERENMVAQAEIERIEEVKRLKEEETQIEDERKQSRKQRRKLRVHEVMFRPSRRLGYNLLNLRKKRKTKA